MTGMAERPPVDPVPAGTSAVDVADALLITLLLRRATALTLAPQGGGFEAALIRVASPEPLLRLPAWLGHAVAARLGIIGGLDPWASGDRLGRIEVTVGAAAGEFVVVLRESGESFAVEVRRLVAYSGATATIADWAVGETQIGPYRLVHELGRGSMGIVYRATREGVKGDVAIKLLNPAIAAEPGMAARFVREGRAAALVNDPGVVGVTDFGTLSDGRAFLVMEFVEGQTLEAVLAERGALPAAEAVRVALRIATALEAAHVRGVVHRDLKPSNIFLSEKGTIKIADFGAARVEDVVRGAEHSPDDSVVLGTPAYMAPEQARGQATDDRADLYSLGCILFRMLSGGPPFRGGAVLELLMKQINEPPPPLSSPFGPLPEVLVKCVARALDKQPENRHRSAGEMRMVLEQAASALQTAAERKATRR
jgi:serine/threonine-protein kinase